MITSFKDILELQYNKYLSNEKEILAKVEETNDSIDCLQRSVANPRQGIPQIILKILTRTENNRVLT